MNRDGLDIREVAEPTVGSTREQVADTGHTVDTDSDSTSFTHWWNDVQDDSSASDTQGANSLGVEEMMGRYKVVRCC